MEVLHYWIILGIILLIAELFTPGFLLASFGIGAFGAGLFAFWEFELRIQLLAFSIATLIVFFGIRPLYFKYFRRSVEQKETGVNAFIGKHYNVTEAIKNSENTGRVQIGSESWRVRSEDEELTKIGETVRVVGVEGSTLIVSTTEKKEE